MDELASLIGGSSVAGGGSAAAKAELFGERGYCVTTLLCAVGVICEFDGAKSPAAGAAGASGAAFASSNEKEPPQPVVSIPPVASSGGGALPPIAENKSSDSGGPTAKPSLASHTAASKPSAAPPPTTPVKSSSDAKISSPSPVSSPAPAPALIIPGSNKHSPSSGGAGSTGAVEQIVFTPGEIAEFRILMAQSLRSLLEECGMDTGLAAGAIARLNAGAIAIKPPAVAVVAGGNKTINSLWTSVSSKNLIDVFKRKDPITKLDVCIHSIYNKLALLRELFR